MLLTAVALGALGAGTASAEARLCSDPTAANTSVLLTAPTAVDTSPAAPEESSSDESDAEPLSPVLDLTAFSAADTFLPDTRGTRNRGPNNQWCFSSADPRCQAMPVTPHSGGYASPGAIKATVDNAPRVGPAASFFVPVFVRILGEGPEGVRTQLLRPPR